jgi:CheY-like chemotaxis protein
MKPSTNILIVEDDPVFRRVLSLTVAKAGFRVETAADGESGLERILRGGIDFLVTDYQMPGFGGLELLRRVNALPDDRRPQAILCTARGLELDRAALCHQYRLVDVMHKPFSPQQLTETLQRSLQTGRTGANEVANDRLSAPPHGNDPPQSPPRRDAAATSRSHV